MKNNINSWSFIFSMICILLFFITSFSSLNIGTYPLYLILGLTLITFVFGVIGFGGIQDWKGMARSAATLMITIGISAFLIFIIIFGSLLG